MKITLDDVPENRMFLQRFPLYTFLPRLKGFRIDEGKIVVSFEEADRGLQEMDDGEFLELFKSVHGYLSDGFQMGRVSKENVYHKGRKIFLLPSKGEKRRISSGRIENEGSFFVTVESLARLFKASSPIASKISKEGIPEILKIMEKLSLGVLPIEGFLPSFGVWRHTKLLQKLSKPSRFVHLSIGKDEFFSKKLEEIAPVFRTVEEIKREIFKEDRWKKIFSRKDELDGVDPSALAFLFPAEKDSLNIFDYGGSIEMHTFVQALFKFNPRRNVIAVHEGFLKFEAIPEIEAPKVSEEEFEWFLKTFFGSDVDFSGDIPKLFERTNGEIFSISRELRRGRRFVENGRWKVKIQDRGEPSAYGFLKEAIKLSRTGKKPYLGLQLVNASRELAGKDLEIFESLRAFFHKVLGEYEKMKKDLERSDAFAPRSFRSAYYSVVLSMNKMDFSGPQRGSSIPLIETTVKYAELVSKGGADVVTLYNRIVRPLESIYGNLARRVEVMARNYIGILNMTEVRFEKAVDEFETALLMAKDNEFEDLIPLIETNIGYALTDISPELADKRLSEAFKESVSEGLWKIAGFSNSLKASVFIETGNFKRVNPTLTESKRCSPSVRSIVQPLRIRMKIEDLDFEGIDFVKDPVERNMLKVIASLYEGDGKKAKAILEKTEAPKLKALLEIADDPLLKIRGAVDGIKYLGTYFVAGIGTAEAIGILKRVGTGIYDKHFRTRAIFYEEQLARAYRKLGLVKTAGYHMKIAAVTAKKLGLRNRASKIEERIKNDEPSPSKPNDFLNIPMLSWGAKTAREVLEYLASDLSGFLERTVRCDLTGIEEVHITVDKEGVVWEAENRISKDFVCTMDRGYLIYRLFTHVGDVYIGFKTNEFELDNVVLALDHLTPLYIPHIERSIASRISNLDHLTGVYTRRHILGRLKEEIERAERYGENLSVAMADIDDFKKFNDNYGHDTGDNVLKKVTRIIRDNVRNIDVVGRYGGEEFLIIFPHTAMEQAFKSCDRIRRMIGALKERIPLTVSIGVAEVSNCVPNPKFEKLVKCADMALYMAKSAGKDHVTKYSENGGK